MTPDPATHPEFYQDIPTKRLLAWCVDMIVIIVVGTLLIPFTGFTAVFYLPFLFLTVGLIYRAVTLAKYSATFGMQLMSIELRDNRDKPLDWNSALIHTMGYYMSMAIPLFQLASVVMMLTTHRHQGLTDLIMGSVAMNKRRGL